MAGTSKAQISTVVLKDCKLEAGQRNMAIKVACILMQKNEALRLQPWLDYHQHLFGAKSLFIFDNGSSIPSVIDALRKAASRGATVDWSHKEASDFKRKSIIAAELVHFLDANDPHDFYFFLDCDEFVACEVNGEPRFDRNSILATLNPYANYKGVLLINGKYRNNPYMPNKYTRIEYSPKCFFARGALKSLASGYHDGESKFSKEKIGTPIIFFEFHYLPYKTHLGLSKQKLVHRTDDLSRRALAIYAKKRRESHHCANDLLETEYEYASKFLESERLVCLPALLEEFERQGIAYQQMFATARPLGHRNHLRLLKMQHIWLQFIYFIDDGRFALTARARRLAKRLVSMLTIG